MSDRNHRAGGALSHRLAAVAMVAAGSLALPAAAAAASFRVTPHIANHTPIVNRKWPVELTVTRGKTKLSGTVVYKFMFAGSVVSTQPVHGSYKFKGGVYRDQMIFPKQSLGQPLTLRFVVKTRYGTEHVDWKIQTKM